MVSLLMFALAMAGQSPAAPPAQGIEGVWSNPKGSVQVRTGQCGDTVCGWVVWASEKAKADTARKSGGPLVGAKLLRGYRATGKSRWTGQLYVPDMGSTFGSTITLVDAQTIRVKGCVVGGLLCKSQDWHRVGGAGSEVAAR